MEHPPQPSQGPDQARDATDTQNATHLFRKLDWAFWANSAWAVLGLVWATFCITPIFDFFTLRWKIASIVTGICLSTGVVLVFVMRSRQLHREGRTSAQLDQEAEERQAKLQQRVDHLQQELQKARIKIESLEPRSLTEEQVQSIVAACLPYADQKASVQCFMNDTDGMRYAQQFLLVLRRAKWDISTIRQSTNFGDFDNIIVEISSKDREQNKWLPSAKALMDVLGRLGISNPNAFGWDDDIPEGELRLRINLKPVRHNP